MTNGPRKQECIDWESVGRDLLASKLRAESQQLSRELECLANQIERGELEEPSGAFRARERVDRVDDLLDKYLSTPSLTVAVTGENHAER